MGKEIITIIFATVPVYGNSNNVEGPSNKEAIVNPTNDTIN